MQVSGTHSPAVDKLQRASYMLLPAPAPRSLPARSMKDSLPTVFEGSVLVRRAKQRMEWELHERRDRHVSPLWGAGTEPRPKF